MNHETKKFDPKKLLRASVIHILAPAVLYATYIVLTSEVRWHGVYSDSLAMLVIIVCNGISIYVSDWRRRFRKRSSIPIGVFIFVASIFLMIWFGFEVRTRYV